MVSGKNHWLHGASPGAVGIAGSSGSGSARRTTMSSGPKWASQPPKMAGLAGGALPCMWWTWRDIGSIGQLDNLLTASNTCSSTQWPGTACPPAAPGHWVEQQRLVLVGRALALFVVPAIRVVGGLVLVAGAWAAVLGKPMGLGRSWAPAVVPVLWAPPLLPLLWPVWWAPAVAPVLCAPPALPLLWRAWKVAARSVLPLLWPAWKVAARLWGGLLGLGMQLGCWSPCLCPQKLGLC